MNEDINLLEKQRADALAKLDSKEYARLCDAMGMEPEDEELYDLGISKINAEYGKFIELFDAECRAGASDDVNKRAKANRLDIRERYRLFLQEIRDGGIGAIKYDLELKKMLMRRYFEQFRHGKSHDLDRENMKKEGVIGHIFDRLVARAEKMAAEAKDGPKEENGIGNEIDMLGIDERYCLFLEKSRSRKSGSYEEEIFQKKKLMISHFPSFRKGRPNDISRLSGKEIRKKFKKLIGKAKEVVKDKQSGG